MMEKQRKIIEICLLILIIAATVFMFLGFAKQSLPFMLGDGIEADYTRARVIEIVESHLEPYGDKDNNLVGEQVINVKFTEGKLKGQVITLTNYITIDHSVILKEGMRVIVGVDAPATAEPYYTLYNKDRTFAIVGIIGAFVLLVVLIGKKNGLLSCIALAFTVASVFYILLPNIYIGKNGVFFAFIVVLLSSAVTCFCISGLSKKTLINLLGASVGCISSALIYKICMALLNISGAAVEEAETLVIISQKTGLSLNNLLLASIMIVSLGAVMDVAVSMGASLGEIKSLNPNVSAKQLMKSGMNIGRDMIGTMTNTLILAFVGGTLATILILMAYGVHTTQLVSSNFIALEVAQGIAGSTAVVLTVPISAFIASVGYTIKCK